MSFLLLDDNGQRGIRIVGPNYLHPAANFSRASAATVFDGGVLREFGNNVPRLTSEGLLLEGQRQNAVSNPRAEGAVAGAPGTEPTGWGSPEQHGITRTLSLATVEGVAGVVIRYAGTPTATSAMAIVFTSTMAVPAAAGQTWTQSVFCSLFAGSMAGVTLTVAPIANTAAGAGVENLPSTAIALTGALQRFVSTGTITAPTAAFLQPRIRLPYTAGVPIDISVFRALPQLELGAFASSPILPPVGVPGVTTRLADNAAAPLAALGIPASGACTLVGRFMMPQVNSGTSHTIAQIDNGSSANRFVAYNSASATALRIGRQNAGAFLAAPDLGALTAGAPFRLALTIRGDGSVAGSLNGGVVQSVTGGPTTGMTVLNIGQGPGGDSIFGTINTLRVLPRSVSDAELQFLSLAA